MNKQEKQIKKLEAKLEALCDHLKVEVYAEESTFGSDVHYDAVVTKRKKYKF